MLRVRNFSRLGMYNSPSMSYAPSSYAPYPYATAPPASASLSGLATLGRAQQYLGAALGLFVIVLTMGVLSWMAARGNKHTAKTYGTVSGSTCSRPGACGGTAQYTVDGTIYQAWVTFDNSKVSPGHCPIYYDPKNPTDAVTSRTRPVVLWLLVAALGVIAVLIILSTVLVARSPTFAAALRG